MIDKYSFGSITIQGDVYKADLKIIDGKVMPNWWRKEGHRLRVEDIQDILDSAPEELVIGTGFFGMMKVGDDLKELIRGKGIKLVVERTGKAVAVFNEAHRNGRRVAAAFHLTC
ncbi:MAG: Mth938-like domain-containing protein [Thermodesulforhabdaceae bacterium]